MLNSERKNREPHVAAQTTSTPRQLQDEIDINTTDVKDGNGNIDNNEGIDDKNGRCEYHCDEGGNRVNQCERKRDLALSQLKIRRQTCRIMTQCRPQAHTTNRAESGVEHIIMPTTRLNARLPAIAAAAVRPAHHQQQRQHQQADDEQQLEIVDIGDDRGLPGDLLIEGRETLRIPRAPVEIGAAALQVAIECRDVAAIWACKICVLCVSTTDVTETPIA